MLIYAMGVSVDGYTADADGEIAWTAPSEELFALHLERVSSLSAYLLGRRLYETMLPWESDDSLRALPLGAEFAAVWTALPKVVFSRTLTSVSGSARLATRSVAAEVAAALEGGGDVEIGGPALAAQAVSLGLVDEFRLTRGPVVVGGGTPYFPPGVGPIPLDLVETRPFPGGVVYERYRRS